MAEDKKVELVPMLFEQCLEVYETMADQATMNDDEQLVYEGFLTRLITQELHYSNPYYTKVTQRLKAMDCIRQLRRGGSTTLRRGGSTTRSRWLLIQPPKLKHFTETGVQVSTRPSGWRESIEQQLRALNERMQRAGL